MTTPQIPMADAGPGVEPGEPDRHIAQTFRDVAMESSR
jgi:hypothetical protein